MYTCMKNSYDEMYHLLVLITVLVLGTGHSGKTMPITWLLMIWLFASQGHQKQRHHIKLIFVRHMGAFQVASIARSINNNDTIMILRFFPQNLISHHLYIYIHVCKIMSHLSRQNAHMNVERGVVLTRIIFLKSSQIPPIARRLRSIT